MELAPAGDGIFEVGLGLRPQDTGRGLGLAFVTAACRRAAQQSAAEWLVLRVAAFNTRAITVYQRAGFRISGSEVARSNGMSVEFVRMTMRA